MGRVPHPDLGSLAGASIPGSPIPRRFTDGVHNDHLASFASSSRLQSGINTPRRRPRPPVLPEGCTRGPEYVYDSERQPQLFSRGQGMEGYTSEKEKASRSLSRQHTRPEGRLIWVDFRPSDPQNPFNFTKRRKLAIVAVATYFTGITAYATSSYSIGIPSMCRELGCTAIQGAAGLALYAWGFGIAPLVLAPLSEEYGRKWTYVTAVVMFTVLHLGMTLGKNTETILVSRFLLGASGSLGATLVGGTISDIYVPEERGFPMALFALMAMFFTGVGPVAMAWVEARPDLGWRWIQWIEMIAIGAYIPLVILILTETRAPVIIRRRAARMRKEHTSTTSAGGSGTQTNSASTETETGVKAISDPEGFMGEDGIVYRFTARSEVGKVKFSQAIRTSLMRPLLFLAVEPVVTFFSVWISLAWGVFYTQIQGLPYIYPTVYGFSTTSTGLIYITMCVGSLLGFGCNFIQDAIYRRQVAKHGVEARLYAPMAGGVALFLGCMLYAFTVRPDVHWIVPAIGITIIIAAVITLYITGFVYLSECYGSYASSALAAMSFLRNMFGGAFSLFTEDMYRTLTPRWAIFLMGMVAGILGVVPFIAYWKGPEIRARSRFSRILMEEEKRRVESADREKKAQDEEDAVADAEDAEDAEIVGNAEAEAKLGMGAGARAKAGAGAGARYDGGSESGSGSEGEDGEREREEKRWERGGGGKLGASDGKALQKARTWGVKSEEGRAMPVRTRTRVEGEGSTGLGEGVGNRSDEPSVR